ncbi:helix-turn-helix transcriptional regulator [Flavisphingomonas formosensis]|uniref:helix-turn-helix transcriptional regulator n=1 Tax=Flavisphingomonas formosensis TaxID=861534 RepID=UPI0012F9CD5F|nr:helix-turn-helix transcriptional regulator [Sphingomonas formosensis]
MAQGSFNVSRRIEAPGVRIELRHYAPGAPLCQTSVQPVYTLGLRSGATAVRARYPDLAGGEDFRGLGSVVFRPAARPWQVESPGAGARVLLCAIDPGRFETLVGQRLAEDPDALLGSFDIRSSFIAECLALLEREAIDPGGESAMLIDRVTDAMLLELRHHLHARPADRAGEGIDALALGRIEKALFAMEDAYPRVEDVAALTGMSVRALQVRFRETTGESLGTYIDRIQFRKAATLLRTTDLPLKAIAWRVGFGHAGNFSTAFRRRFGVTPSDYRRSH